MGARLLTAALGVWLMAAPAVLGYEGALRASDRIAGPLLVALSLVAAFQVMRALRWWTVPVGAWLLIAPWVLGAPAAALASDLLTGVAVLALSVVRGRMTQRYGGGWAALRRAPTRGAPGGAD